MTKMLGIKRVLNTLAWLLVLFLAVNTAAPFLTSDQSGLDAAYARCAQAGWTKADLELRGTTESRGLFGQTRILTFASRDPKKPKSIHLVLRLPLYRLHWQVDDYAEKDAPP